MSLLLYRRPFYFQMLTSKILITFEWYQPFRIMSVRVWVGLEQGRITLLWESVYFTLCKQSTPSYQYLFAFFRLRPEIGQAHAKTCACPTSGLRRKAQIKVVLKLTRSDRLWYFLTYTNSLVFLWRIIPIGIVCLTIVIEQVITIGGKTLLSPIN